MVKRYLSLLLIVALLTVFGVASANAAAAAAPGEVTLKVLDPRSQFWGPLAKKISPRIDKLDGKKIMLVSNGKSGGDDLLDPMEKAFKEAYPKATIKKTKITFFDYANKSADMKEIANWADVVVEMLGDCGSCTSKSARDAGIYDLEYKIPSVIMVASVFTEDAKASVQAMGLPDLPVVTITVPSTNGLDEAELIRLGKEALPAVVDGLTKMSDAAKNRVAEQRTAKPVGELIFKGKTYQEAMDNMDKFFLSHRMSDGYPVVPPTREAVDEMIAASGMKAGDVIGVMEPRKGLTTVEMVAVNGVMAGCRPAYMPVLVAIAKAMCDPHFDMHGVMSTAGLAAPLVIISGPIVKDINLNYSFSALGPGWRANSSIGRASRMFCTNIGKAWPGINDMKDAGNPAKFGMVLAENEEQTPAGWGTWRERLGFKKADSTVTLYAAQSFRQFNDSQKNRPHKPYQKFIDPMVIRLLNSTLGTSIEQWGKDVILDLSAGMAARWASWGYTPEMIQEEVWKRTGVPRDMLGNVPFGHFVEVKNIPEEWDNAPLDSLIPIVPTPQDIRIIVGGGNGADASLVIDRWGAGGSFTTTHKIEFPKNWDKLVKDLDDWKTPIVVK